LAAWSGHISSFVHPRRDCGAARRATAARRWSAVGPGPCREQPGPGRWDRAPIRRAASAPAQPAGPCSRR